ncbi:13713_t:CDS:2 [Racocetra fulgida]|uniref:13713_t:CDS:1 n=1 Tax=Racocetra fulgida TaxID=60492 RepID=A0A9N9FKH6_9GLOM|nr:13713_t:CDS:2 [Racocetra fulgida]
MLGVEEIRSLCTTNKVASFSNFTYQESKSSSVTPRIWRPYVYKDGTLLVRIIRRDAANSSTNKTCLQQILSLRLIFPNGTVSELDIDLKIQPFNYCLLAASPQNPQVSEAIRLYPLQTGYFLVKYFNATDVNDFSTYEEWIMLVNWNGAILSKAFLGHAFITPAGQWDPLQTTIRVNISPEKDEGYAIIYANSSDPTNSTDPLIVRAALYIQTIGYGDPTLGAPLLLYQLPLQNIIFSSLFCDISPINVGQICTLGMTQNTPSNNATNTTTNNSQTFYAKISFLSSGSVIEFTPISRILPTNLPNVTSWVVTALPYGGYLLLTQTLSPTGINMYAYIFDEYNTTGQPWELPEPFASNVAVSGLLRLTLDGSTYYESLDSNGKTKFFASLQDDVSKILPIAPSRLSSNQHVQVDFSISPGRQIFLSLNLEQTRDKNERSVASLIRDLNTMVRNKDITPIGLGNTTKYLDDTYGFAPSSFVIITKENTRPEFFSWFIRNGKVASIFTVLAGADIEALAILRSNLAGFSFFQAPFSEDALSKSHRYPKTDEHEPQYDFGNNQPYNMSTPMVSNNEPHELPNKVEIKNDRLSGLSVDDSKRLAKSNSTTLMFIVYIGAGTEGRGAEGSRV